MTKDIALLLLQLGNLAVSVGIWLAFAVVFCRIKYKTLKGFWGNIGICKPKEKTLSGNIIIAMAGYLFTILVYVILKIVNGGMTSELLVREKEVMSVPMLILCILIVGLRSGFGEEIFFRGVVAAYLFEKMKFAKANILQALIFMLPHIVTFLKLPGLESGLLLVNAFVFGLAAGKIMQRSESIVPTIIYHGVVNMIAIPIAWYLL